MLSHLSLMTPKMRKSRNSLQRQVLVRWGTRGACSVAEMRSVQGLLDLRISVFFLLSADGMKLRVSKNEANGSVKPPEMHPVSNVAHY